MFILVTIISKSALVETVYITCTVLAVIGTLTGLGMYEANAIQFGMDQMMEASSEQLSYFIHWYFWCTHVGSILIFYWYSCRLLIYQELPNFNK